MRRLLFLLAIAPAIAWLFLFGPQTFGHALLSAGFPAAATHVFGALSWKGAAFYAAGRWDEAAEAFSHDIASAYDQGVALAQAGRMEEAIAAFDRALAANPRDEDAAFNKALLEQVLQREQNSRGAGGQVAPDSAATKLGSPRERSQSEGTVGGSGDGLALGHEGESMGARQGGKAAKASAGERGQASEIHAAAAGAVGASGGAGRYGDLNALVGELMRQREQRAERRLELGAVHPSFEWLQTLPDDPGRFLKARIRAEKARRLKASGGPIKEDD